MKYVVVTGVSSGIGRAVAEDLIAHGYSVLGSVRKERDAAALQAALGARFTPLLFDVTDEAAVKAGVAQAAELVENQGLAGLVNNAGIGNSGPLQFQPLEEFRYVFDVNVFGTLAVTQAFLPLLGAAFPQTHAPGRIVNITSVGGRITYPFLGAYAASKHALEAMCDALRRELGIYGIDVIAIEPGSIRTSIWDKAEAEPDTRYSNTIYGPILARMKPMFVAEGRRGMPPSVVARTVRNALEKPRPKARYALPDSLIVGWLLPRWLPTRWFDRLVALRTGLGRRHR